MSNGEDEQLARRVDIESLMAAQSVPGESVDMVRRVERLCRAATQAIPVFGAAVGLMSDESSAGVVAAADEASGNLDELQFILGEGPSRDAFMDRRPILIADLLSSQGDTWPTYRVVAAEIGIRGVFAFPLHIGMTTFGVFTVYADHPNALGQSDLAMALTAAEIATEILLDGDTVPADRALHPGVESVLTYRSEVYQAQGVLMVDLNISLEEALVRMRAHAFRHGMSLVALARLILSGDVVLESGPN